MGGMQRYGPTERAVTLWGHEIACLFPFGDMKMLTLFANMCCRTGYLYLTRTNHTRDFLTDRTLAYRCASLIAPILQVVSLSALAL